MPVQSWAHGLYWRASSTVITTVSQRGGYPTWQAAPMSLVLGSGFGGLAPFFDRIGAAIYWGVRCWWMVIRWDTGQRQALARTLDAMNSPLYPHAVRAVKMTAVHPAFNTPQAWKALGQKLHARGAWAENAWRHLDACDHFDQMARADGSTVTNQARSVMVELAYQGFARAAVGSTKA